MDAVDLVEPRVFTIAAVQVRNGAEQPVQITLSEFPRPWRPAKSMSRVMAKAWGLDSSKWVGHRVTLFCDPRVKFGAEAVGGIRISHMDGISKDGLKVPLIVSKGKSGVYLVKPLTDAPVAPSLGVEQIASCVDEATLRGWWNDFPVQRKEIEARVAELRSAPTGESTTADTDTDTEPSLWPAAADPGSAE